MIEVDKDQLHLQEFEALYVKQLRVQQRIELHQARILKAFNKKIKGRIFRKRGLVLAVSDPW